MIQKTDYLYNPLKANESYHKKITLSTKKLEDNLPADKATTTQTTSEAGNSKKQIEVTGSLGNLEANNLLNNKEIPFKSSITRRGRTTSLLTTRKFPDNKIAGDNQTLKNTTIKK